MVMFFSGLFLFFVLHFAAATPALRGKIVSALGEMPWKGVVTIGSFAAIALICRGWSATDNTPLFAPSLLALELAPLLVSAGIVLFVIGGGNLPGHIRRTLHHPMLVGIILWSGTHLMANGGLRESWLFGSFLVFAVYALITLLAAGKRARFVPAWKWDAIGLAGGLFIAVGVLHGHQWLFGVAVPLF
jgi:uncharacterized membrane protein